MNASTRSRSSGPFSYRGGTGPGGGRSYRLGPQSYQRWHEETVKTVPPTTPEKGPMRYYAGIGSRATPDEVLQRMEDCALELGALGFTLRSGAAPGADSAFERGVLAGEYPAEVFLPWAGFEDRPPSQGSVTYYESPQMWAYRVAQQFHPSWESLSSGAAKLMARNSHQVFGPDEYGTPIDFAVCYTPQGRGAGGTGQVIRICRHYEIPVLDLGNEKTWEVFAEALHYYIDEEPRAPRNKSTD